MDPQPNSSPAPAAAPTPAPGAPPPGPTNPPAVAAGAAAAPSSSPKAEGTPAPTGTPETPTAELEIKLPEGVQATERLGKFKTIMSDKKMTLAEKAQAIVDMDAAHNRTVAEQQKQEWEQTKKTWEAELKADPEFGGQHYQSNLDFANKAAKQFGGEPAVKRLEETGLGRDPVFVKMLAAIGKAIADDKLDIAPAAGGEDNSEEALYRKMFNNSPTLFQKTA